MPLADDPLYGPKPKPQPTQPKPAPYKAPPNAGTVNSNTGSRAYAGRNPALTQNPNRTPTYANVQPILPYKSRVAYTKKLANTAAQLIDTPYLTNYWLNDVINSRKSQMDDRKDLAKAKYENLVQDYERNYQEAIRNDDFEWINNNRNPKLDPDGWKKLVDRETPINQGPVNKLLEEFVQRLQGANDIFGDPNSTYQLNLAFNRAMGTTEGDSPGGLLKDLQDKRRARNDVRLTLQDERLQNKFVKQDYIRDIQKDLADGKITQSEADLAISRAQTLTQKGKGSSAAGIFGASAGIGATAGYVEAREDNADKSDEPSTFDKATKFIPVVGPYLEAIGEDNLNKADDAIGNPVGQLRDIGETAIDYLSRPLNAVAEGIDTALALDEDKKNEGGALNRALDTLNSNSVFLGGNPLRSIDEIVTNPSNVGKILGAMGEGFTNEYNGGFARVIANEAERNPAKTVHDGETYQAWAGLGFDLVADPLNFIGVGLITKPATLANQAVKSRKLAGLERIANQDPELQRLAVESYESLRGIPAESRLPNSPKSVNEVYDILTGARANGQAPKKFATKAQRTKHINNARNDLKSLEWELQHYGQPVNAKITSLNDLRQVYGDVFEGLKGEAGNLAYLDEVERVLQTKVNKGELTPEQIQDIQEYAISVPTIARAIQANGPIVNKHKQFEEISQKVNSLRNADNVDPKVLDKLTSQAESLRLEIQNSTADDLYDLLGPRWHYGSGLTREETNKIANSVYKHLLENDETFGKLAEELKGTRNQIKYDLGPRARNGDQLAQAELEAAQYKLPHLYRRTNMRQAAAFLQAVKAKRAQKAGSIAYIEPKNANELIATRDEIKAQLADPNISIEDQQELTDTLRQITSDLNDLKVFNGAYGIRNLPPLDSNIKNLVDDIPPRFVEDESLDVSDAVSLVYVDPATLVSRVTDKVQTAGERQWAERLKNAVDEYTESRYLQEQEKVTRRNREAFTQDMLRNNLNWYKGQPVATMSKNQRAAYNRILDEVKRKGNVWFPAKDRQQVMNNVAREAFDYIKAGLSTGHLNSSQFMDETMTLDRLIGIDSTADEIYEALTHRLADQHDKLKAAKATVAKDINATEDLKRINAQIARVEKELKAAKKEHFEARKAGQEASREYARRVQEESLLYMARRSVADPEKKLTLHTVVGDYSLPSISKLTRGMDSEVKNAAIIKTFRNVFNDVFQPPSKQFGELADAYRQRTAQSARRIQVNLEELNGSLGKYPPEVRKSAFKAMLDGNPGAFTGTAEQYEDISKSFDSIIKAFAEPEDIGGYRVTAADINKYLDPKYKLRHPHEVHDLPSLIRQMQLKAQQNSIQAGKGKDAWDKSVYADPFDISWKMRLAIEQARAQKSFIYTLGETFGLKNIKSASGEDNYYEAVQKLKKDHDFRSVEALGSQYVFDKDTADLIDKMVKSLEPEETKKFIQIADAAVGHWKAAVTIYNPAYWVKNGIGEVYMSFLAGVTDPTVYATATRLVKHARGDGAKLESLKALHPWAEHLKNPNTGSKVAIKRRGKQRDITYDDLLVAYHENGLKTGFFDNDLSRRMTPTRRKLEQYEGLNRIAKGHEKLRSAGEGYEDMLRMAHFIDYIKKSNKPFEQAAKEASEQVRKYHFDYDDFSQLEKSVMLRAFPFYKWTRKAAPLMLQMLFMKPGKVSAPFKIANAATNNFNSQDIFSDDNGWAPNYEDIAPGFVRDMWAYELFGQEEETTYGGIPLPTAETYRNLTNPVGMAGALTNPLVKLPYNVGNELANDVINDDGFADSTSVFDEFMNGLTPQTKFINKGEDYKTDDFDLDNFSKQEIFSFLTGVPVFTGDKNTKPSDFNPSR